MKLAEIILLENCPDWLKNSNIVVSDEDIELIYSYVIWKSGTWESGIWKNGTWESGTWKGGIWESGTWKGGIWENGTWKDGIWEKGTWQNGIWESGTWESGTWKSGTWQNGIWERGTWKSGTWQNGIWERGTWKSGTWENGTWENGTWFDGFRRYISLCKWDVFYSKTHIRIGCKENTIDGWVEWLNSDEEFETSRSSKQFIPIKNAILTIKFITDLEK